MIVLCILTVYPYLNVLVKAFNEGTDTMLGGLTFFPRVPTWENMNVLLHDPSISMAAAISAARVVLGTLLALIVQFSAAYAFNKKSFAGRRGILILFLIPMYFSGGVIPFYLLLSKIGFLNNFLVYIIPGAFSFYNMIIIKTYMHTIPISLEESAKLDGANEIIILFRIILPLSMPIIATVSLWVAVGYWNDWVTTLFYITKPRLFTLQYILMQIIKESERLGEMVELAMRYGRGGVNVNSYQVKTTPEALKAAQVILTTIPIIVVYPFLQKYFIKGVMIGAIKE